MKTEDEMMKMLYNWKMECESYTRYPPREQKKDPKLFENMKGKKECIEKSYKKLMEEVNNNKIPFGYNMILDLVQLHNFDVLYGKWSYEETQELLI